MVKVPPKELVLFACCVATLSSGTNYAFSSWGPQLAVRLNLSSTQLNVVALMGNMGMYLSGPLAGRWIDKKGPQPAMMAAALLAFIGYGTIRAFYDGGQDGIFNTFGLPILVLGAFATGTASCLSLTAALNGLSRRFTHKRRGSAMSLALAGFGLSAFFYSSLARSSFLHQSKDHTSAFLLSLQIGCGLSMGFAIYFLRVPPPSDSENYQQLDQEEDQPVDVNAVSHESMSISTPDPNTDLARELDISGWQLFKQLDFWLFFAVLGLCSGTGLMYINNLGTVIHALAYENGMSDIDISLSQSFLVSLLSLFNCLGRLLSGFLSDYYSHHAPPDQRFSRAWWLVPISFILSFSQLRVPSTASITGTWGLSLPTAVIGTCYGGLFGIHSVLMLEWFGHPNFSTNTGWLTLSPSVVGNVLSIMFGHIFDSHVEIEANAEAKNRICKLGQECYAQAFHRTFLLCLLAGVIAICLSLRRKHIVVH